MSGWAKKEEEDLPPYDQAKADRGGYSGRELTFYANKILREAANEVDASTGKTRGIGGDNPILFEEHERARKRREIYNTNGVPDPSLVAGIYNRSHPEGRKINSPEARKKHGASYYR